MKRTTRSIYAILAAVTVAIGLSACGGGAGSSSGMLGVPSAPTLPPKTTPFTVGGYVGGLAAGAQVTLLDNGGDTLTVTANGAFTFATAIPANGNYAVTVGTQPTAQTCSVTSGSGNGSTTYNYNVTSVRVSCAKAAKYAYVAYMGGTSIPSGVSQYTLSTGGALTPMATATVSAGSMPLAIAADPAGQYVYAVNNVSNNVSQYTIDATTGALTPMSPATVATGTSPIAVTVDPTGKYVYVVNANTSTSGPTTNPGSISQYAIGSGGVLVPMSPATVATDVQPMTVTVDPTGQYVYVANSSAAGVSQYTINSTGGLVPMSPATVSDGTGTSSSSLTAAIVSPDGKYVYGLNGMGIAQYSIGTNGALSYMGSAFAAGTMTIGGNHFNIDAFDANIYVTNNMAGGNVVTQVSIVSNGNLMVDMSAQTGNAPGAVITDPTGAFAFVVNGDATVSQYTVNATQSGANMPGSLIPQAQATVPTGASPTGIVLTP